MKVSVGVITGVISLSIIMEFFSSKIAAQMTYNIKRGSNNLKLRELDSNIVLGNSSVTNYYYADIHIGQPAQTQSVILDTGSPLLAVPCNPYCSNCGHHQNAYYNIEISNNASVLKCNTDKCKEFGLECDKDNLCSFNMIYAEQSSLSGIIVEDFVHFGSTKLKPAKVPFGCTRNENNLFYNQNADGIMGLARSSSGVTSSFKANKVIDKELFTLCFAQNGGYISIGEINSTRHLDEIKYLPTVNKNYAVRLEGIQVADTVINIPQNTQAIIDSGSTITYIPQNIYNSFRNATEKFCSQPSRCLGTPSITEAGVCLSLYQNINSLQFLQSLPTFIFTFEGNVKYFWKPENYIFNYTAFKGDAKQSNLTFCFAITSSNHSFILGSNFMHNHDFIFDNENDRIGIVESDCGNANFIQNKEKVYVEEKTSILFIIILACVVVIIICCIGIWKLTQGQKFLWLKVPTNNNATEMSVIVGDSSSSRSPPKFKIVPMDTHV